MEAPRRTLGDFFAGQNRAAWRDSVAYGVIAILWIVAGDKLLEFLLDKPAALMPFAAIKDVLFIGGTALFIFSRRRRQGFDRFDDARPGNLIFTARRAISTPTLGALIFFLLAACGSGFVLYQSAKNEITRNASNNLESIAKLKALHVESWLQERRIDTDMAVKSPLFLAALQAWLKGGKRHDAYREDLLGHLRLLTANKNFRDVSLRDATDGSPLLSLGEEAENLRLSALSVAKASASASGPILDQLQADEAKEVSLRLLSPIRLAARDEALALIVLLVKPETQLYPPLQRWPGGSTTAETLLLHRTDDQVTFINALRHRAEPPLNPRSPLTTLKWVAAPASDIQTGALRGVDYRAEPVLAYTLPVAETPWLVVTKIDEAEVYAQQNRLAALAAALFGMLTLLAGWWLMTRRQQNEVRQHLDQERFLLSRRVETLVRHANDCILVLDADNRIIEVNERCLATYGYSRQEMLSLTAGDLLPEDERDRRRALRQSLTAPGPLLYETRHRRKDGSCFPVEISKIVMDVEGEKRKQAIVRDISERKANEARILQLSRLSATLSALNHAIAHAANLEEALSVACRACVEHGGFKLAWIGLADRAAGLIPVSHAYGEGLDYLNGVQLPIDGATPEGRGPTATAFCEQRTYICNDYTTNPATLPWRHRAAHYGIAASIALPISRDGVPAGVLTAYSGQPNTFDAAAEHLLEEIAESLSFAMHHFAEQAAKRETDAALRKREEQLQEAQAIAKLGHWEYDLETGGSHWSPQMYRLFERDPACGPADLASLAAHYTPESARLSLEAIRQAIVGGQRVEIEQQLTLSGQRTAYHAAVVIPVRNAQGRTLALHGTVQDITEHKLTEKRLTQLAQSLAKHAIEVEDLYQNAPCGYHSLDQDGVVQRINETELRWLGYSRDEVIGKMKYSDLLPTASWPDFRRRCSLIKEAGEVHDVEYELIRKDGTTLPVLVSATAIRDQDGLFLRSRSTVFNMTERKKMENERHDYAMRLADLSRRLVAVQEEGRRQLSAALHDRTSPNLAAIDINLGVISKAFSQELSADLAAHLADIRALLEDTTASIREISTDLRPPLLDYAGLLPALEGYAHQFEKRTGTALRVDCTMAANAPSRLPPDIESLLFRIAQEALTNCAKHACATAIELALDYGHERTTLTIADNGKGFNPEQLGDAGTRPGLGLLNMREMTEFVGGRFEMETNPGRGTAITVEIGFPASRLPASPPQ